MHRGESIPNRARKVVMQHREGRFQPFAVTASDTPLSGRWVVTKRGRAGLATPSIITGQPAAVRAREPLGVTGEGNAGRMDGALLHRCGDQRAALDIAAQLHAEIQLAEYVAGVAGIESSGPHRPGRRHRQHLHDARPVGTGDGGIVQRLHRHRELKAP